VAIIEEPALADLQAERVAAGEVLALAQAAFDARMKEADRVYEAATSMALIHREKATRAVARFTEIQKAARLDLQQEKAARIKAYRVLEHQVKARLKRAGIEMDRRSYAEGLKTA
jgi:hypothetical protein